MMMIDAFNSTARYLDDLLNIDNIHFEQMVQRIYPAELKLNTSSPKGNDRSPDNKQVFLNSSQVSKRFFQLVKGS